VKDHGHTLQGEPHGNAQPGSDQEFLWCEVLFEGEVIYDIISLFANNPLKPIITAELYRTNRITIG
jgi:hypothetical protein